MYNIKDYSNEEIKRRDSILNELVATRFVENYANKIWEFSDNDERQDAIQQIYLDICNIEPRRLFSFYEADGINGVRKFVSGIISRELRSQTSPVHLKLRRHKMIETPVSWIANAEEEDYGM